VRPLFTLMPDLRGEVERWAARGEELFIEMTLHGTLGGRLLSWRVCDRITLRDGVAVERESYFDSLPLLAAVVRTPRSWPRYLRVQARRVIPQIAKGRKK
jgi:ketosteroid isomerase-like protein